MPARRYNSELRLRKQAELKARIAEATAGLHAQKGVHGTSYADIAAAAGVSLPTVYAHFPTQRDLLAGCTSHVAAGAPPLPVDAIFDADHLGDAATRLVEAIEARHRYYEPWLSWREDRVIPFLAELSGRRRSDLATLIAKVLARHLGPGEHREAAAGWEAVLSFDFWHRLARGHGLGEAAVRRTMLHCLEALAAPNGASPTKPSPRRKR